VTPQLRPFDLILAQAVASFDGQVNFGRQRRSSLLDFSLGHCRRSPSCSYIRHGMIAGWSTADTKLRYEMPWRLSTGPSTSTRGFWVGASGHGQSPL